MKNAQSRFRSDRSAHATRQSEAVADLEELERTALEEIEQDEFSEAGIELSRSEQAARFLQLMAGSMALAGLTGCTRQPDETIMPYVDPPENVIPGRPKFYATAVPVNGVADGVLVESHMGRPTKWRATRIIRPALAPPAFTRRPA